MCERPFWRCCGGMPKWECFQSPRPRIPARRTQCQVEHSKGCTLFSGHSVPAVTWVWFFVVVTILVEEDIVSNHIPACFCRIAGQNRPCRRGNPFSLERLTGTTPIKDLWMNEHLSSVCFDVLARQSVNALKGRTNNWIVASRLNFRLMEQVQTKADSNTECCQFSAT